MKIYTKTGDLGETTSCNGGRVLKNHVIVEANGAVDECNACVGVALSFISEASGLKTQVNQLKHIQHFLFDLGTELYALGGHKKNRATQIKISIQVIQSLEKWIDQMEEELPSLTQFILPAGLQSVVTLHHARSVCRRAERRIIAVHLKYTMQEESLAFINRLSDYFFVLSRFVSFKLGVEEIVWKANSLSLLED
jgi:cob(I)alamin adenosyltransferase